MVMTRSPSRRSRSCCSGDRANGSVGGSVALHEVADPLGQLRDQPGLPPAPGGGAGGQPVGLGERDEQVERVRGPRASRRPARWSPGRPGRGGRRCPGSSRWWRTTQVSSVGVVGRETHRGGDVRGQPRADDAVVTRPPLADVVQQRADEQQVRTADGAGQPGGVGGGLGEVPVDGEAVVRVALRTVPDVLPVRQQALEQTDLVQRLQHRRPRAGRWPAARRTPPGPRPATASRSGGASVDEPFQRVRRDRQLGAGGGAGGPQHEHRVASPGSAAIASTTSPSCSTTPVVQRAPLRPAADQRPIQRCGPDPARRPVPGHVPAPGDGPGRLGDRGHQRVGARVAEGGGDGLLLLQQQPVAVGAAVQLTADVQQRLRGLAHLGARARRRPRRRRAPAAPRRRAARRGPP